MSLKDASSRMSFRRRVGEGRGSHRGAGSSRTYDVAWRLVTREFMHVCEHARINARTHTGEYACIQAGGFARKNARRYASKFACIPVWVKTVPQPISAPRGCGGAYCSAIGKFARARGAAPQCAWAVSASTTLEERCCSLADVSGACAHYLGSVFVGQAVRLPIHAVSVLRPV